MVAGKGFATEAGKQAASGLLSFVIKCVAGGMAAKFLDTQVGIVDFNSAPRLPSTHRSAALQKPCSRPPPRIMVPATMVLVPLRAFQRSEEG
jgi:hypothetical protein